MKIEKYEIRQLIQNQYAQQIFDHDNRRNLVNVDRNVSNITHTPRVPEFTSQTMDMMTKRQYIKLQNVLH